MSVGRGFVAITPSDTDNTDRNAAGSFPDAIYVGTGGNISMVATDGSVATLVNIPDGTTLPFAGKRINSTGTTASDLVGVYI